MGLTEGSQALGELLADDAAVALAKRVVPGAVLAGGKTVAVDLPQG